MYIDQVVNDDCLDFLPLLEPESVDMCLYDVPYHTSTTRTFSFKKGGREIRKSYTTDMGSWDQFPSVHEYYKWLASVLRATHRVLKPQGAIYLFCRDGYISDIRRLLKECDYRFKKVMVWVKRNPFQNVMHVNYNTACEFQLFSIKDDGSGKKTPRVFNWMGQRRITFPRKLFPNREAPFEIDMHNRIEASICQSPERIVDGNGEVVHKTQKPIEILIRPILVSSNPGDIVLDACSGVGSTLEAARLLGRHYIGCEIEKDYCSYSESRLAGNLPSYGLSKRMSYVVKKLTEEEETITIDTYR